LTYFLYYGINEVMILDLGHLALSGIKFGEAFYQARS